MAYTAKPLGTCPGDVIIDFAKVGDTFPLHEHKDGIGNHVTIVVKGGIGIIGTSSITGQEFYPPSVIDWGEGSHGFVALADNTRIVNVGKRSRSRGVDDGEREAHQRRGSD
jgi:hypothetical protein